MLIVLFAGDSQIYYKHYLSAYNYTIFYLNSDGYCQLWNEITGMKGSSEIGTGHVTYSKNLPTYLNHKLNLTNVESKMGPLCNVACGQ